MVPLADTRLYAFIDAAYLRGRPPAELARQLADGGADLIQLRAKDWTAEQIERTAAELVPVCAERGVWLVINDHPGIARRVGAPLAHLGQEDFFDTGHRHVTEIFPPSISSSPSGAPGAPPGLGLSTHSPEQARRALAAGPAYIAIGPVFPTPTKPGRPAVTLDYVRWAASEGASVPWFAIGGITLETLDTVLAAGARRICVVSAILNDNDPARVCREFRKRMGA